MKQIKQMLQVTFIVIITTVLLIWANQNSLYTYWQQTYHKPPPWQSLSTHPTWEAGSRLPSAAQLAATSFWQEIKGVTPKQPVADEPVADEPVAENRPAATTLTYSPIPNAVPALEMILMTQKTTASSSNSEPKTHIALQKEDRILFAGDSMMQGIAPLLASDLRKQHGIQSIDLSKQSTGLAYPSAFNWPKAIDDTLATNKDIKLLAVFLGPNDPWDMPPNKGGKYLRFASPEWEVQYRERIQSILASAKRHGANVVWVSPPNMRKKKLSDGVNYLSTLYESEVLAANEIHLSANTIFKYDATTYSDYPGDGSGQYKLRANDGIHFTRTGQRAISDAIFDLIIIAEEQHQKQENSNDESTLSASAAN